MSLNNLLTSHSHPSVTHSEQIIWTASDVKHYTSRRLFTEETRSGTTSVFVNLEGGVSVQSPAVDSAGTTSVPEGCTKV